MTDEIARLTAALAGRYRVERELGQGGMATVYLAHDLKHERPVALKVLRPELAAALGAERFLREIRLTARLDHPHILPLHDSGDAAGSLYYVMPYVEGESLRERLTRERQLPLEDALQITREVADALGYAHSFGIVHRDIKPENILLAGGHARVADFGIARAVTAVGGSKLTETGLVPGTPAYMSPEQAGGDQDVDGRSDLYSLGCVLYEMLAGEPPFTGPSAQAVVAKRLSLPAPRVSILRDRVPGQVEQALDTVLARTPADRFATAAQFAEALVGAPGIHEAEARGPRRWMRRVARVAAAAGLLAVTAGALLVGRRLLPGAGAARHPRAAIAVLPLENLNPQGPNAYFAGGLHDEVLTQLAKVAALTVIGRTSVLGYEGTSKRLRDIGDELGVGSIVGGSVQVAGNQLRVHVQLIDARTESQLWAETYDGTVDSAFAVQSEIARRIAEVVGAKLSTTEAAAIAATPTANPEAYRLYLQAEQFARRPGDTRENWEAAQGLYERALALDPGFALAHAALSYAHGMIYQYKYDARPQRRERQWAEAETALRLAPRLPQAHFAVGVANYIGVAEVSTAGLRRALREFLLTAEGMPGSGDLWSWIGSLYSDLGDVDGLVSAYAKAVALDPRNAATFLQLAFENWGWHRYPEAVSACERALELAPDLNLARYIRAMVFVAWRGQLDTLRVLLRHGPSDFGVTSALRARVRLALWERQPDTILALLPEPQRIIFESQEGYEPGLLWVAWAHRLRGDSAAARISFRGALGQLDSALRILPSDWRIHESRGLALAALGRRAEAERETEWLRKSGGDIAAWAVSNDERRARILAQEGLTAAALPLIEHALTTGESSLSVPMLGLDPRWDPIRSDPRFQALLARGPD